MWIQRYGTEKAPFGKIPCVRGENQKVQTYIAKQKIAIHKLNFEVSEISYENADYDK